MAWDKKYRIDFKDIFNLSWWVFIEDETAGTDASTPATPTDTPLIINFLSNGDNIFESPICGSTATLNIYADVDFQWIDLYSFGNLTYRVSIYYGTGTLYWQGFINSSGYQEPYDGVSYPVSLSASDGLGQLKDMLYKYTTATEDDTYYNGRRRESQIIIDILAKIRVTGFSEYVNIYEAQMDDAITDSPFAQTMIDVDVFRDMDCYTVLTEILRKYGAVIRQVAGEMIIYRPSELEADVIYGRKFITATGPSAVQITTSQLIDRNSDNSDIRSVDGGYLSVINPAKKVTIKYDYGYRDSLIKNWELVPEEDATFEWWTGGGFIPMGWALPNETSGVAFTAWNSAAPHGGGYLTQTFGPYCKTTANNMVIEFEYGFNNFSAGGNNMAIALEIKSLSEGHYLYPVDELTCAWWHTYNNITITFAVPKGYTGWTTYRRDIPTGLPEDGEYIITLWAPSTAGSLSCHGFFKNVKFIETSDEISVIKAHKHKPKIRWYHWIIPTTALMKMWAETIKHPKEVIYTDNAEIVEKEYVVTNPIKGVELEYNYLLGDVADSEMDNVVEQFTGSLAVAVKDYQYRVDTITLTGTMGDANITCDAVTSLHSFADSPPTLSQTAADFVTTFAADYTGGGVVVTSSGADIIFTSNVLGAAFTGATTIANTGGNLSGSVDYTTPAYYEILEPSAEWNRINETDEIQLLEIIGNEIASQFSYPTQLLSLPIVENNTESNNPQIKLIGKFTDVINIHESTPRLFVFNRGIFFVRDREWDLDIQEIIHPEYILTDDALSPLTNDSLELIIF